MKNFVRKGDQLALIVSSPTKSGDPVIVGNIVGVAATDSDAEGKTVISTCGVFEFASDLKLEVGNPLYIGDGKFSVDPKHTFFGTVVGVDVGKIEVWLK
ncbi:MAG: DUF2190 family protein [Deltaproteobacteria bacterium]|nr:DUF2190 family protein [Deltaproteobacteria bacterium]